MTYTYSMISLGVTLALTIEWPAFKPLTWMAHSLCESSAVIKKLDGFADSRSGCCTPIITVTVLLGNGSLQNKKYVW